MAECNSSGLRSAPVAASGILSQVPRSLNAGQEKREEYEISEETFNRRSYNIGGGNSYEGARRINFPANTESLYSGSSSGIYESAPRQLTLAGDSIGSGSYRAAA